MRIKFLLIVAIGVMCEVGAMDQSLLLSLPNEILVAITNKLDGEAFAQCAQSNTVMHDFLYKLPVEDLHRISFKDTIDHYCCGLIKKFLEEKSTSAINELDTKTINALVKKLIKDQKLQLLCQFYENDDFKKRLSEYLESVVAAWVTLEKRVTKHALRAKKINEDFDYDSAYANHGINIAAEHGIAGMATYFSFDKKYVCLLTRSFINMAFRSAVRNGHVNIINVFMHNKPQIYAQITKKSFKYALNYAVDNRDIKVVARILQYHKNRLHLSEQFLLNLMHRKKITGLIREMIKFHMAFRGFDSNDESEESVY